MKGRPQVKDRSHREAMVEYFRENPSYAERLLAETRRDGCPAELTILLRQMADAFGMDNDDVDQPGRETVVQSVPPKFRRLHGRH